MGSTGKSTIWSEAKKSKLLKIFEELYPDPQSELNFKNDYQLLISVILSAQCTDKKVNQVTPELFSSFKNFKQLGEAKLSKVEQIIRQVNYYKTKSKNIIKTAEIITEKYRGKLPLTREELEALPGVGRKTTSVVLSEKDIEPAFPVDTHVFRVSRRLKLATRTDRDKVEEQVRTKFDPKHWRPLHHWLIFHGRRVCKAQTPLCGNCSLSDLCPSAEI